MSVDMMRSPFTIHCISVRNRVFTLFHFPFSYLVTHSYFSPCDHHFHLSLYVQIVMNEYNFALSYKNAQTYSTKTKPKTMCVACANPIIKDETPPLALVSRKKPEFLGIEKIPENPSARAIAQATFLATFGHIRPHWPHSATFGHIGHIGHKSVVTDSRGKSINDTTADNECIIG